MSVREATERLKAAAMHYAATTDVHTSKGDPLEAGARLRIAAKEYRREVMLEREKAALGAAP